MKKRCFGILLIALCMPLGAQEPLVEQDESFDPLDLYEPSLPILDGSMIYEIITDIKEPSAEIQRERRDQDSTRTVEKMGWKVQIYSSTDFYQADTLFLKVLEDFIDQEVVKEFNSPYYKIRVGNCNTREAAEALLERAIELKYREAWIIRTPVKTEEKLLLYIY